MSTPTNPDGGVPLDTNNDVPLANLLVLVADEVVAAADSTALADQYTPSAGRVAVTADDTVYVGDGSDWVAATDVPLVSDELAQTPQDVRAIASPTAGDRAFHDGSGTNTEGPAHYTSGGAWVSTVDGTTIS